MQVTRKDYAKLYRLLLELPNLTIHKNVGTTITETLVSRSFTSSAITKFNKNKRALKEEAEAMFDVETNANKELIKLEKKLKEAMKGYNRLSDTELDDIRKEVDRIREESNAYFDGKIELPNMFQIEEADIEGWEFTGSNLISYFWDYLVKYKDDDKND